MKKGKFERVPSSNRKLLILVLSAMLLVTLGVGGSLAYFAHIADPVINTFQAGSVEAEILETVDGNQKTDIQVKNTGKSPVYVRVRLISYWMDGENIAPMNSGPVGISLGLAWIQIGDYYYYTKPLASGAATENLLAAPLTMTSENGFSQVIEVLADTVQASPPEAVQEVWKIQASDFAG